MSSIDNTLTAEDRTILMRVARQSIEHGLRQGCALIVQPADYPESLRPRRATFITLEMEGNLRGCIGTLEARDPLVVDVAEHAYAAAFQDPRFPPLRQEELARLAVHISILSPSEPLEFSSEDELLRQLRPGIDGLILRLGHHRATFLPSVWESLPAPRLFLSHLKRKAGLSPDFWSDAIEAERYVTESFGDSDSGSA
jgi:hypothetical protein